MSRKIIAKIWAYIQSRGGIQVYPLLFLLMCLLSQTACGAICGNGVVEKGESCDDGNVVSGDVCPIACKYKYIDIATGDAHSCVVLAARGVKCWGNNNSGQLGDGTRNDSAIPVDVIGVSDALSITAGEKHNCVVLSSGKIECWGNNSEGQLGNDDLNWSALKPTEVLGITDAIAVTAGSEHTCALLSGGGVKCWGSDSAGQLGDGSTIKYIETSGCTGPRISNGRGRYSEENGNKKWCRHAVNTDEETGSQVGYCMSEVPLTVVGISNAVAITAGKNHTCARLRRGGVKCWGNNKLGALGNGSNKDSSSPVDVIGTTDSVWVHSQSTQTCALFSDSEIRCWGESENREVGYGSPMRAPTWDMPERYSFSSTTPESVHNISGVKAVYPGPGHICVLTEINRIKCWGSNKFGKLGNGTVDDSSEPEDVVDLNNITEFSTGSHSCAIIGGVSIKCWGYNSFGQLGAGYFGNSNVPVDVVGINGAKYVSVGDSHSCAVMINGSVKCWGKNERGELGNGTLKDSFIPTAVEGINDAVAVIAGYSSTCALLASGGLKCWGFPDSSEYSNSKYVNTLPVNVKGITDAIDIRGDDRRYCALLSSGGIKCWGQFLPSVHENALNDAFSTSIDIQGISDAISISVFDGSECATLADGSVRCWEHNSKWINGRPVSGLDVLAVEGINDAISISLSERHNCATLKNGHVKCWDRKYKVYEQPKNVISNSYPIPVELMNMSDVKSIYIGYSHACAILSTGNVQCVGACTNILSLGNSSWGDCPPVEVSNIHDAVSIVFMNYSDTCALLSSGNIKCWSGNWENGENLAAESQAIFSEMINVVYISSNNQGNFCVVMSDGNIKCWGSNLYGQLGNGGAGYSSVPLEVTLSNK